MNAQDLKNSILHLAIQGKLVEQREEEGTAKGLLEKIEDEKKKLVKEKKIKKQKALPAIKEDEIPFDIPASWEWVRIAEIGEIVGGGTPKTGNSEFWSGGDIPWLTPADMKFVKGKYVKNGERFITDKGLKGSSARLMPKGTIIYSSRAPIGYIAIAENDLATNQGFKSLVPYEISVNEYMYYCLISRTNEIISRASGTTFKEISGSEFGLTIVPLPPLEEQKRIVAKIEELMPYVEKYDIAYSEVKELNKKFPEDMQKSILQYAIQGKLVEQREEEGTSEDLAKKLLIAKGKLLSEKKIYKKKPTEPFYDFNELPFDVPESWRWVQLCDVAIIQEGAGIRKFQYRDSGIQLFSVTNILEGSIDLEKKKLYVSNEEFQEKYTHLQLNKGDIVTACSGGSWGKVAIYDKDDIVMLNTSTLRLRFFEDLGLNRYLYYIVQSAFFKKQLQEQLVGIQPNFGYAHYSRICFPLPSLEEQKRIVAKLEEVLPLTKQLVT